MSDFSARYAKAKQTLVPVGQEHVLAGWPKLSADQQKGLLDQIDSVDWPELARLVKSHVQQKPEFHLPGDLQPAPWYPCQPRDAAQASLYAKAKARGEELLKSGRVAAFMVAGGQGTRLGWDGPKGTFPATPIRKLSLFACFAEYLLRAGERWGRAVPLYLMTSPANDAATKAFFKEQHYFGLNPADVMIFPQAMMPAVDPSTAKVLMESSAGIALSPNGHGGSLKALFTSGAIADMQKRGVTQISYTQVDNPSVRLVDPLFIGLHELDGAQMSSKMLPKREPLEKLGNFCLADGRMTVIEYSDLPNDLAMQRLADGQLRFQAGSIAIHMIQVDFVHRLNTQASGFALPYHRADKKVPFYDPATGQIVKPEKPNAVKLETFVFDALPMCDRSIIYQTDRVQEFAPIKNADIANGVADDSPASSKRLQTERAARWLEQCGVKIPRDGEGVVQAVIEISQKSAIDADDLARLKLPAVIVPGESVLL